MQASPKKTFRRQFIELSSGNTLAQVFSLILMPVISRIYLPAHMGEYAIYVSISSIMGMLSNFRLDLAVILAGDEEEASRLVWLGLASAVGVGFGSWVVLDIIYTTGTFSFLTATSITCMGGMQCLVNWHSRRQSYALLASRSAGEKLLVLVMGIGLGYWGFEHFGLMASQTAGLMFSVGYLFLTAHLRPPRYAKKLWTDTVKKFLDFPLKNMLSTVMMTFSMFLPALLFSVYFEKHELGFYSLATRVFDIPINLVGYAFSTVYYRHNSQTTGPARLHLFWKTLRLLTLVFLPAFLAASFFGPSIFGLVFGANWRPSGELAEWLSPLTAARLLYVSQSSLLLVNRRLSLDLVISGSLFAAQMTGFAIGCFYFHSIYACVVSMSVLGSLVYLSGLGLIHKVLRDDVT